jgi:maleylacetate reductase
MSLWPYHVIGCFTRSPVEVELTALDSFQITFYAEQVMFGGGAITRLDPAADLYGWRRMMLCTSPGSRSRGHVKLLEDVLGERLAVIYDQTLSHVQQNQVEAALQLAWEHQVDAVIGMGGGSSIGMAKAISLALEERRTGRPARAAYPTDQPLVPVVAIPTTYAGSEMTPVYGVTHLSDGVSTKVTLTDAKVAPKLAIYDPEMTLDLSPRLTAGTGINAVAHCIEALYSIKRNPITSALARSGLEAISRSLPICYASGSDLPARTEMLMGACLAGTALAHVSMGLHHGICHVLGGATGVAHGDANSVMLPHVVRFNLETASAPLAEAAVALGIASEVSMGRNAERDAEAVAVWVETIVKVCSLPWRLRDIGVLEANLHDLALQGMANRTVAQNPRPITEAELESLLRRAW